MKRQGMRGHGIFSVVAGVVAALVLGAAPGGSAQAAEPFKKAELFFEYNSVEGNIGLQFFFDADEWTEVEIRDPKGRVIFETEAGGNLRKIGGAELRFESVEPAFDPNDPEFFNKFPKGSYTFTGQTVEGGRLKSTVKLSHKLPAAPVILSATLLEIEWMWTQGPLPPFQAALAGFQVIVEIVVNDIAVRSLTVDFPPSVTSLVIPPAFLQDLPLGAGIVFEVLANADNGNKTITQGVLLP